jgi:hypothetical protein
LKVNALEEKGLEEEVLRGRPRGFPITSLAEPCDSFKYMHEQFNKIKIY